VDWNWAHQKKQTTSKSNKKERRMKR
jgi:hypothetical protein